MLDPQESWCLCPFVVVDPACKCHSIALWLDPNKTKWIHGQSDQIKSWEVCLWMGVNYMGLDCGAIKDCAYQLQKPHHKELT